MVQNDNDLMDSPISNYETDLMHEEEQNRVRVLRKVYEKREGSTPTLERLERMTRAGIEDDELVSVTEDSTSTTVSSPQNQTSESNLETPSPASCCRDCEDKCAHISTLDTLLREISLEKCKLQEELISYKERLRSAAIQKDDEDIGFEEQLMESKTVVDRQQDQIKKLAKNLEKREIDYFSTMEELAESKSLLKKQQQRVEELFDEVNSEKRTRGQTEGWLVELRDQCLKLKNLVEERTGLKETISLLSDSVREEKRVRAILQNNYNKLWEINKELENGDSAELSATRAEWHRASQRNQHLERQLSTLMNRHTTLQQQVAYLENSDRGRKMSFSEAISGILSDGIDKASHSHIEVLTSDLSLINRRIAARMVQGTEVKKLMASLHPDRTPIPACKETLQARFQLINHIRSVLG